MYHQPNKPNYSSAQWSLFSSTTVLGFTSLSLLSFPPSMRCDAIPLCLTTVPPPSPASPPSFTAASLASSVTIFQLDSSLMDEGENTLSGEKEISLPPELLSEILSWLDVRSLLRFKTVCKKWRSLIEDCSFIRAHMNKSRDQWVFRPIMDTDNRYEFVDSYFGLILEHNYWTHNSRLRNPSTRKILELPNPGNHIPRDMKMCHIRSSDALKLVVPCQYASPFVHKEAFLVLTVGIDTTWREIDIPRLANIYASVRLKGTAMVGEVCFMLYSESGLQLVCLEMGNEQISRIKVPNGFFPGKSPSRVRPIAWGENLALASVIEDDDEVHIWVLEDHKIARWAEKKMIIPLKFADPRSKEFMLIWKCEDNGLLINFDDKDFLLLDVPSGKIKRRYLAPEGQEFAYYHVPSLQHPKGD